MTTSKEILELCKYFVQLRDHEDHYEKCYECDGFRSDAIRLYCPYYVPYSPRGTFDTKKPFFASTVLHIEHLKGGNK